MEAISEWIRKRRAVFPKQYTRQGISEEDLREILENANWAPTHKHTEPWRFKVIRGQARQRFGDFLAEKYTHVTAEEDFSERKLKKLTFKIMQSDAIIFICMQRDPAARLPEWEELAAVACAVQNMWLTAAAKGIGAYWSTPWFTKHLHEFCPLGEGEICLGIFYMGTCEQSLFPGKRTPVEEKLTWIDR
jgi:nitroreductase